MGIDNGISIQYNKTYRASKIHNYTLKFREKGQNFIKNKRVYSLLLDKIKQNSTFYGLIIINKY